MILLLDTSTATCHLLLYEDDKCLLDDKWEAGRTLAENIFTHIEEKLAEKDASWKSLAALGVFRGPGSFTGLRIGMSVLNTLAHDRGIPIVGATGENWQGEALKRLKNGEDDKLVLPEYGREARITKPRK